MPGATGSVPGKLVSSRGGRLRCRTGEHSPRCGRVPVHVASTDCRLQPGQPVFSVGCDHGAAPTVRESRISAVNRYAGAPNLETLGHPVEGRSGGGCSPPTGV